MDATLIKKKVILVVEDDRDVNELVCDALDDAGFVTLAAFDGSEGMKLVGEERPDVILMDIILPDTDGIEICRNINRDDATRGIPIIMLTGRQDLSTKLSSYIAGARRYITKPFRIEDLIAEVEKTIRQRENTEREEV